MFGVVVGKLGFLTSVFIKSRLQPKTKKLQAQGYISETAETRKRVPAYTTKPTAWSVFLTVQPRSSRFSIPAPTFSLSGFSLQQEKLRNLLCIVRSCQIFITPHICPISNSPALRSYLDSMSRPSVRTVVPEEIDCSLLQHQ